MGIANPAGALALAAVAVLIALTLFQRRDRVRRVSSLLLWGQLPSAPVQRRRFRIDLLLLLQLALLLALIGGYVRPYLDGPADPAAGTALVAVLDCSASMQAREDGGTRFELARRRLAALLAAQATDTRVMLVTAAERPHVALRWTSDAARVTTALAALAPVDTPTRLEPAVELALGAARRLPGTAVVVLSDLAPLPHLRRGPVRWIQVGRASDNVAVTGLRVEAPPFADRRTTRVVVSVQSFAATERTTTLDVSVGGVRWARRVLRLPPRGGEDVLLDAPPATGVVHVRTRGGDALAVDDEAFGWLPAPAPLDLLLVTEADPMAAAFSALVAALPGARLEVVNAAGWRELGGGTAGQVVLFDRLADEARGPALHIAPPPGDPVCRGVRRVDGAAVVDWDATHPITAGLGALEALEVGPATQLGTPSWGRVVVHAASRRAAFPLLVAGERHGHRQACLAAALPVPLASADALPLLMLVLGTLRWASADAADAPVLLGTGIPSRVPGTAAGGARDVRVAGDVLLAERVGVHRLPRAGGGERLVLANLFDASESDIGRDRGGEWPAAEPAATVATPAAAHAEFGWWLYAVGAALLAVEWVVGRRR